MSDDLYYYSYSGDLFDGLRTLRFACVLKPGQYWPPTDLDQYLHIHGPHDQHLREQRYGDLGAINRWRFAYRLDLNAIDLVFVDVDTSGTTVQEVEAINALVLRFLSERLPQAWNEAKYTEMPAWYPILNAPYEWSAYFETFNLVHVPQPESPPVHDDAGGNGGIAIFVLLLVVCAIGSSVAPKASSWDIQIGTPFRQPFQVTLEPTPIPANLTVCPLGCTTNPANACPSPIKGTVTQDGQHWYYTNLHPLYWPVECQPCCRRSLVL